MLLWLVTDASEPEALAALAGSVTQRLSALPEVDDVAYRIDPPDALTVWVWSTGDALELFGRIVGLAASGWEHRDSVFIGSRWTRSRAAPEFLVPGIHEADVAYRRWTGPARRSRAELTG
ncbi:hypothetical protein DVA67_016065 [Solirubrobacter sp. CPCC 204708]|uniref:Uncharacterized protein n=1 Tax=Solirubrobacter deserti TaxID=2282478 RepID=A0ABT4RP39_9ACTN|nr:hypothetical protein [Solirubrobacter deserti]MBE2317499.1 hypothetical protein [Solirubrobacter deserti]MDA0140324.1 hypothetical protein [Solirubrobacter deserti]